MHLSALPRYTGPFMSGWLFIALVAVAALADAQTLKWTPVPDDLLSKRLSVIPLKNEERGARLEEMFKEAGCDGDHLQRGRVNKKWDNIVCTLSGLTDEVIVVGAHYDHVKKGEGAVDNWSGSSLLPRYIRLSRNHPGILLSSLSVLRRRKTSCTALGPSSRV